MARKFLATLLTVVALVFAYSATTPTAQDAEGDACAEAEDDDGAYSRRKICEGWGTTLKNNVRVAFAKTGERPVTLTGSTSNGGCGLGEGSLTTRHGAVLDQIFAVEGDDDAAAMVVEEIVGGAFGLFEFNLLDGAHEWHWYDTLDELNEAHDDIDVKEIAPDAEIQLMKLYAAPGRNWTHRVVEWRRGGSPNVETVETEVDEVSDGFATWSSTAESETGNSESKAGGEFRVEAPSLRHRNWAGEDLPVETVATDAGEFECRMHRETFGGIQTTTWVSTKYHPLVVKQVRLGKDYTEIRKLKSFYLAEADPWLLFRMVGRNFKMKWTDEDGEVGIADCTVVETRDDGATLEIEMTELDDEDEQPEVRMQEITFGRHLLTLNDEGIEQVNTSATQTLEVEAGEFECYTYEDDDSTQHYSMNWMELPVKIDVPEEGGTLELISFDLGHDMRKFYGTVGNYYVMEMRSEFQGFKSNSSMRTEIIEVLDGKAKVETTTYDQNGNELASHTMDYPVPGLKAPAEEGEEDEEAEGNEADDGEEADGEDTSGDSDDAGSEEGDTDSEESESEDIDGDESEPVMPYDGQVEEWITTPAGGFAAIRTSQDMGGMETVSWTWNGIPVRSETESEDVKVVNEIIELHME